MIDKDAPPKKIKKEQVEGLFITPEAVLHNNLYSHPSQKTLNDNKGSLKDTLKKFQWLFILAVIGLLLILLMSLS
ncbi:MAG TPA: hypothetical protein PLY23_03745 [Alphaproteobacteria bacterium]|nr:hypothetical protein [Alphaproteobacteria bacterium]HQS93889.1 hypothetical protein [Alphaproteobacteria bacterium]